MARPSTYGKIHRAVRSASGFMEHGKPGSTNASGRETLGAGAMMGQVLSKPPKRIVHGGAALAPKIPGKGSPKRPHPTTKPTPHAGKKTYATGAQTKTSSKLAGY